MSQQTKIFTALLLFAGTLTGIAYFFGSGFDYVVNQSEQVLIEKLGQHLQSKVTVGKKTVTLDQILLEDVSVHGKVQATFDKIVVRFRLGSGRVLGLAGLSEVEIYGQNIKISGDLLESLGKELILGTDAKQSKKHSTLGINLPKLARLRIQHIGITNTAGQELLAIVDLSGRLNSADQILEVNASDLQIMQSPPQKIARVKTGPIKLSQVFSNDFQRISWRLSPTGADEGALKYSINGSIDLAQERASFSGQLRQQAIDMPIIAKQPIGPYDFRVAANINWNKKTRSLRVEEAEFNVLRSQQSLQPPIRLRGEGSLQLTDGQYLVTGQIKVPPTACNALLQLDPEHLTPRISEAYEAAGSVSAVLSMNLNALNLKDAEFNFDEFAFRCRLSGRTKESTAQVSGLGRFGTPITTAYQVRAENPSLYPRSYFVPFANIPEKLVDILVASEDIGFFNHHGIDHTSLSAAIKRNLSSKGTTLGGSTITMQLARNIFLSPERTLVRKIEEVFYTKLLEDHLTKGRILEIYLNSVEFGPGIYGVSAAANHFFDKKVQQLNLREIIYLVSILPGPTTRYKYFCDGEVSDNMNKLLEHKVSDLRKLGRISDDELAEYNRTSLDFSSSNRASAAVCQKGRDRA